MSGVINARIPPRVEQKLAEYCVRQGVRRTEVVVRALDQYLDAATGGPNAAALAADLIPARGAEALQSDSARKLARKAFGARRSR